MAIAHVSTGTALSGNAGTTTVTITYPGSLVSPNIVLAGRTVKPQTALPTAEEGWTRNVLAANGATGGTGTTGADTGQTRGVVDYRIVNGSEGASVVFDQSNTPNSVSGCMIQYSQAAGNIWEIVWTTGDDATKGTGRSATGGSISLRSGDWIVAFAHSDTDDVTAYTSPAITATGMTITTTQRLAASGASQGNDCGLAIFDGQITAGTLATVAPVLTLTGGPSNCGVTTFVRLRETPNTPSVIPTMPPRTVR